MLLTLDIRRMRDADWPAIEAIYREGIATGQATFESEPPDWPKFDAGKVREARLVATLEPPERAEVVAWAAASLVSSRPAYRGAIEHSIYVAGHARGLGIGKRLLDKFIAAADSAGYWLIQSSIFPENLASLALHEQAGFRVVGRREKVALMSYGPSAGCWRDTLLLERRSSLNGQS